MNRAYLKLLSGFATALLTTGCGDVFFAEMELPEVCFNFPDQAVVAAPIARHGTISRSEEYKIGDKLPELGGDIGELEVRLLNVSLTAKEIPDFGFLDEGAMQLDPPTGASIPTLELARYVKDPIAAAPSTVVFTAPKNDVVPYLANGVVKFTLTLTGTMPTQAWKMDTKVCAYARGKVRYLDALQKLPKS